MKHMPYSAYSDCSQISFIFFPSYSARIGLLMCSNVYCYLLLSSFLLHCTQSFPSILLVSLSHFLLSFCSQVRYSIVCECLMNTTRMVAQTSLSVCVVEILVSAVITTTSSSSDCYFYLNGEENEWYSFANLFAPQLDL